LVVTLREFELTLAEDAPRDALSPPLTALWWAKKGAWDKAHRIVMDETGADAAWVHAYLHRVEGDLGNAGYWYRQAGKPVAAGDLGSEWTAVVAVLLKAA
jgi:hypothetical protein